MNKPTAYREKLDAAVAAAMVVQLTRDEANASVNAGEKLRRRRIEFGLKWLGMQEGCARRISLSYGGSPRKVIGSVYFHNSSLFNGSAKAAA
jgi:hypothetical protein